MCGGVYDFLEKFFFSDVLFDSVCCVLEVCWLVLENCILCLVLVECYELYGCLIGCLVGMQCLCEQVGLLVVIQVDVLVFGEIGVGKEVVVWVLYDLLS